VPVVVGKLVGLYGVSGWFRVQSFTDPADALLGYTDWLIERGGKWQPAKREAARRHGKGLVAKLGLAGDRDEAAEFVGAELAIERNQLAPAASGEYYWNDLAGLLVVDMRGRELGRVDYLLETGGHDVLVITGSGGETLIPFVLDTYIKNVDLSDGRIVVDWEWD